MAGTLRRIAVHLVEAVSPLAAAFRDDEQFQLLMRDLGWLVTTLPPSYQQVAQQADRAVTALSGLADDAGPAQLLAVVEAAGDVYRAVAGLTNAPAGVDPAQFLPGLADRLLTYLLGQQLLSHAPTWYAALEALGVVAYEYQPATADRPAVGWVRFDWDQLPAILSDPGSIPGRVYGWGTAHLDGSAVIERIADLANGLDLPVSLDVLARELGDALQVEATGPPSRTPDLGLTLHLFDLPVGGEVVPVGLALTELPAEGDGLPGLVLLPIIPDGIDESVDLGGGWTFALRAGSDLSAQLGVVARPDGLSVRYPFAPGQTLPSAGLGAKLTVGTGEPVLLFGTAGGTRLEAGGASASTAIDLRRGALELTAALAVNSLALVVSPGGADSFLGAVLGDRELRVDFPLELGWSSLSGLQFRTTAGFEVTEHPGVSLGLLRFEQVDVGVRLTTTGGPPALAIQALVSFSGTLGPFALRADRMGIELALTFKQGNAGPFDLALRPVWPSGFGLSLNEAAVSGGGFLSLDEKTGRYAGVFALTLAGTIAVRALGIITTRRPDGQPGYAVLLMITADGFTPIQLGLGFMLVGIGGLIALNRTVDARAIRGGLSDGVLDSVLFAADPVVNADQVLSTLDKTFPAAPDRLLVGPLAEIVWGSPPVVRVRLALLLELPRPLRAVLLAALSVLLPEPGDAVVELHVDAIGVLDLSRGELSLDASLHHSRLWRYPVSGDLALRLNWGDDPTFLLSVGGFHPRFTPPAGLRPLKRMTISLSEGDNPRIRFESYLALTSNTIQFGARVALRAEAGGFGVDGGGAFDALVRWAPFGIDVSFDAWVSVFSPVGTLFSARLSVEVTGPRPWHVVGVLTVHLLFFSVDTGVNFTIGEAQPPLVLDTVDVFGLLMAELARPQSWSAALPPGQAAGVTLGTQAGTGAPGAGALVHPLGTVSVRQKVVPLATLVTRVGATRPKAGPRRYDLDAQSPAGIAALPLLDRFAPAQFTEQTEDQVLAAPSFVSLPAGLSFVPTGSGVPADRALSVDLTFETLDLTTFDQPAIVAMAG